MAPKKMKPEISLEFKDVSIEIKVCGPDLMPEHREFVKFFPELDTNLTCRDQVDAFRRLNKKERKKLTTYEYKLVPNHQPAEKETEVKVLPKLNCEHCGKTFSRRSTLEQHVASHDKQNSSWEEVQDAALKDIEHDMVFGGVVGKPLVRRSSTGNKEDTDVEETEISPPTQDSSISIRSKPKLSPYQTDLHSRPPISGLKKLYKCGRCGLKYRDMGNLKKHIVAVHTNGKKLSSQQFIIKHESHQGTAQFPCPYCHRKFSARAHLDRHMPVHSNMPKPYTCDICGWKFHLLHNMQRHKSTHDKGKKAKPPPNSNSVDQDGDKKTEEHTVTEDTSDQDFSQSLSSQIVALVAPKNNNNSATNNTTTTTSPNTNNAKFESIKASNLTDDTNKEDNGSHTNNGESKSEQNEEEKMDLNEDISDDGAKLDKKTEQ